MDIEHHDSGRKPDVAIPDWSTIKRDYEAGDLAVREIGRRHGVSDSGIHKHAKAEGWKGRLQPAEVTELPLVQTEPQTKTPEVQTEVQTNPFGRCEEFDWSRNNDSVLIPDQAALAIYRNPWQEIVIRQERAWDENEDVWVRFNPEHLPRVIERLQQLLAGDD